MFKAFFVAKTTQTEQASIRIFCQFRNKHLGVTTELPSSQNLGNFCFPLGAEHVKPKEYAAPEVRSITCKLVLALLLTTCAKRGTLLPGTTSEWHV